MRNKFKYKSAYNRAFKRAVPKQGFVKVGNTQIKHGISKIEIDWLDHLHVPERSKLIRGFHNKIYIVDGFDAATNTCYEMLGGKWHGSHKLFTKNRDMPDPWIKKSPNQLYNETVARFQMLHSFQFKVFFVWDYDYKKGLIGRYYTGPGDTLY